ncbi:unnamed protein product [Spirodela intermedia]|uniref:Tify domain-containing protein n=1 Tax=Spirodela intermedia TaxID=51605 RepID=A0A7I8KSP5_SPIIN|nr:unnamed protein product [Spirodela intermedia]
MERSHDEIDFFRMKRRSRAGTSCRGIQSVVSKISPQLLKTVMASGEARDVDSRRQGNSHVSSDPSFCAAAGRLPSPLPVFDPNSRSDSTGLPDLSTLTIFYNGTVTAVNITHDKAGAVIKMVESLTAKRSDGPPKGTPASGNRLDLPIMRSKSLYRFLEKRKERLASSSPYRKPITTTDSC